MVNLLKNYIRYTHFFHDSSPTLIFVSVHYDAYTFASSLAVMWFTTVFKYGCSHKHQQTQDGSVLDYLLVADRVIHTIEIPQTL